MALLLVSQSSYSAVATADIVASLGLNVSDFDTTIADLIGSACDYIEGETSRSLRVQTWTETYQWFPLYNTSPWYNTYALRLELSRNPVTSVTSVQYYDSNNTLQTLAADQYQLIKPTKLAAWIQPATSFPVAYLRGDAVQITYVTAATTNLVAKQAVRALVSHWWNNRQDDMSTIPEGFERLLGRLRVQ